MVVRTLTAESMNDAVLQRLMGLNNAAVPAVSEVDQTRLRHLLSQSPIALITEETTPSGDVQITGFCLVMSPEADYDSVNFRWFADRYQHFIYLDRVVVDPAYQGHGLGRAMYEEVIARAAQDMPSAEQFCLEVNLRPRNDKSLGFHERLGFTEVGQQETPYGILVAMMTRPLGDQSSAGN
jgi:predicted GNAT superfamily acetyltransferase